MNSIAQCSWGGVGAGPDAGDRTAMASPTPAAERQPFRVGRSPARWGERGDGRPNLTSRRPVAWGRLGAPPLVHRYEHPRPGDLLHLDTKKLGRIAGLGHRITGRAGNVDRHHGIGWDLLHIAVDDYPRVAYVELRAYDHGTTVAGFLRRALR